MLKYSKKLALKYFFSYLLVFKWIVLLKPLKYKFGGGIFGRCTHKIAISNQRIKSIDGQNAF
jgi:hypothetical protein